MPSRTMIRSISTYSHKRALCHLPFPFPCRPRYAYADCIAVGLSLGCSHHSTRAAELKVFFPSLAPGGAVDSFYATTVVLPPGWLQCQPPKARSQRGGDEGNLLPSIGSGIEVEKEEEEERGSLSKINTPSSYC